VTLYVQPHLSQYDPGASFVTRTAGCTWTSVANGIAAISGGRYKPTPDAIHALLPNSQETNPTTPGWSIDDAVKAAGRFGVSLVKRSGDGWDAVENAHNTGHSLILQGDSHQFPNNTCSGAFDGAHCIHVHPRTKVENGITYWWIDDPICPEGRWADKNTLRKYAEFFAPSILFAVFTQPVPSWSWQWKGKPPLFIAFTVDEATQTWTDRHQVKTRGTRPYHCTRPASLKHHPGSPTSARSRW
jgi:hypothetical protein